MASILSISYDPSLLATRELVLRQAGYQVASALQFADALRLCSQGTFDLIIIGHSIPRSEKQDLLVEIRKVCNTPVLSLYRASHGPLEGVDYALDGLEGPEALLAVIRKALANGRIQQNESSAAD